MAEDNTERKNLKVSPDLLNWFLGEQERLRVTEGRKVTQHELVSRMKDAYLANLLGHTKGPLVLEPLQPKVDTTGTQYDETSQGRWHRMLDALLDSQFATALIANLEGWFGAQKIHEEMDRLAQNAQAAPGGESVATPTTDIGTDISRNIGRLRRSTGLGTPSDRGAGEDIGIPPKPARQGGRR